MSACTLAADPRAIAPVAPFRVVSSALASLVEPARAGDKTAMRTLLRGLAPVVLSTARRFLRHSADAEEAAQDAMITLVRDLPSLREPEAVVGFARRAAMRVAMRVRKRAERSREIEHAAASDRAGSSASAGATEERSGNADGVMRHLESLPEEQAEVLVMQFVLGFSPSEIAGATGVPVNTVRSRVRLGREALAKRLLAVEEGER